MNPSPKSTDALVHLVDTAAEYVKSREDSGPRPSSSSARHLRWLPQAVMGGALVWGGYSVYVHMAPPSRGNVVRDLESVIDQTRALVEKSRVETGKLPDRLPSSALAAVVRYEPMGNTYRLSTVIMGVRLTQEPDGKRTVKAAGSP